MDSSIVEQGLELMLYGMGTVVVFLSLLVVVTKLMSRLIAEHFPEPEVAAEVVSVPEVERSTAKQDKRLIAVIGAAVHRYRSGNK